MYPQWLGAATVLCSVRQWHTAAQRHMTAAQQLSAAEFLSDELQFVPGPMTSVSDLTLTLAETQDCDPDQAVAEWYSLPDLVTFEFAECSTEPVQLLLMRREGGSARAC